MKTRHFTSALLCCLLVLGACTAKRSAKPVEVVTGPRLERVADFFRSYINAFNDRDMDMLVSHYSADSQTRVFGSSEQYTLGKEQLLAAFEMKKAGWENRNVRFVGFDVVEMDQADSLLQISIAFRVESNTWSGEYPVVFEMEEDGEKLSIVHENMS